MSAELSRPRSLSSSLQEVVDTVGIVPIVTYDDRTHPDESAMIPVTVLLNDELHNFIRRAVTDGLFDSMDDLLAHAIGLVRREAMLGRTHDSDSVSFASPVPTPTPMPAVATANVAVLDAPPVELRPVIDLTRQGFDSPAFMGDLVGKIERKTAEDRAANKQSGIFKPK